MVKEHFPALVKAFNKANEAEAEAKNDDDIDEDAADDDDDAPVIVTKKRAASDANSSSTPQKRGRGRPKKSLDGAAPSSASAAAAAASADKASSGGDKGGSSNGGGDADGAQVGFEHGHDLKEIVRVKMSNAGLIALVKYKSGSSKLPAKFADEQFSVDTKKLIDHSWDASKLLNEFYERRVTAPRPQ